MKLTCQFRRFLAMTFRPVPNVLPFFVLVWNPRALKPLNLTAEKIGDSPIKSDMKLGTQKRTSVLRPSLRGPYNLSQNHGKW